jgi:hypothetical protein
MRSVVGAFDRLGFPATAYGVPQHVPPVAGKPSGHTPEEASA